MPVIHKPVFAQTPRTATAVVTTAVSDLTTNTPTNTVKLFTAGDNGAIVTSLTAVPRSTVTDSSLLLFLSKDGGTTKTLVASALMKAHTVATTTAIPATVFEDFSETEPLRIEAGDELYVGTAVTASDGIVFTLQASDF